MFRHLSARDSLGTDQEMFLDLFSFVWAPLSRHRTQAPSISMQKCIPQKPTNICSSTVPLSNRSSQYIWSDLIKSERKHVGQELETLFIRLMEFCQPKLHSYGMECRNRKKAAPAHSAAPNSCAVSLSLPAPAPQRRAEWKKVLTSVFRSVKKKKVLKKC